MLALFASSILAKEGLATNAAISAITMVSNDKRKVLFNPDIRELMLTK